ncbi:HNH endonuclease [Chryseobacterium cucumeris]|uniref:HNH endonuclease n=1 Tax=Chryseobacterium cucumeris TaxID=1813611 RepID=A0ABX9X7C1_9FLAO|nr:HNH endonuclease signature motif containing protein [Chryseobacterium cucumeris]ROH90616.1 HNH endonuclease [Chryseobacterium cucumeris]
MARFFNVDPLSEQYDYQSHYNFSENKVVDARELEGLEAKKVNEVSLPGDPVEFAEFIGGGINSVRAAVANSVARTVNVLTNDAVRNKYVVDDDGGLTLLTGVPKESFKEKVVNGSFDLATIGMAAVGGVEGALTAQGGKIPALRAFESVKAIQKNEARAARLNKIGREGKDFTKAGKQVVIKRSELKYGKVKCEMCGIETTPAKQSKKGVVPEKTETQVDHIKRKREGGRGNPDNGQVLCRGCNLDKH